MIAVTTEDSLPLYQLKPLAKVLSIPMVRAMQGSYSAPGGLPTNYVIDRDGVIRYAEAGAFDLDALNTLLVPLLRAAPSAVSAPASTVQAGQAQPPA